MLIAEWRHVLKRAWSVRFTIMAGALSAVEVLLPMFSDAIPRGLFAVLSVLAGIASAVSRVVAQPRMHDDA